MNTDELWRKFCFDVTPESYKSIASEVLGIFPDNLKDRNTCSNLESKLKTEAKGKIDYPQYKGCKNDSVYAESGTSSSATTSTTVGTTTLGSGYGIANINSTYVSTKSLKEEMEDMKKIIEDDIKNQIVEELNKMIVNKIKVTVTENNTKGTETKRTVFNPCGNPVLVVPAVRHIEYKDEPGKEQVTVIFEDLSHVTTKCASGDKFDINVGVALAIMEKMFGSKTAYRKYVANLNATDKRKAKQAERLAKKKAARAEEEAKLAAKNAQASKKKK